MILKRWTVAVAAAAVLAGGLLPASAAQASSSSPAAATAASDWNGDGAADIVGPDGTGRLWLYPGNGSGGFRDRAQIGTGWGTLDEIRMVGNWDGAAGTDIIARATASADLWLYPGNGAGGFLNPRRIGTGWGIFSRIFAPGDWDGDGRVDLLAARKDNGTLWMYPGNGSGGFGVPRQIGTGWGAIDSLTVTGDWDGDGRIDFVARNRQSGALLLYGGNGSGGFAFGRVIGNGWGGFTALLGPGDWDGDGRSDILARSSNGNLTMYRGDGGGGFLWPYPGIGTGWNAIIFPGDAAPAPAPTPTPGTMTARQILAALPSAAESNAGYDRALFRHWIDADRDCYDTRAEVLQQETRQALTYSSSGCTVYSGEWFSYYDGATWTLASAVQIDHMVPLAEAWGSGARVWTASRREAFANDLAYPYSLEAVTSSVNQSKGARDPAEWMPPAGGAANCTYAVRWVAVKYRWALTVDNTERNALTNQLAGSCGDVTIGTPPRG